MTNEELCLLAKDGNLEAFNTLVRNLFPKLKIMAASLMKDKKSPALLDEDDLVQEGALSLMKACNTFLAGKGVLFWTYASTIVQRRMLDYMHQVLTDYYSSYSIYLDDTIECKNPEDEKTYMEIIPNEHSKTPLQLLVEKENDQDLLNAFRMISARERSYILYRFGFEDDNEHSLAETAQHFHLSPSRAKKLDYYARDNFWLELPWWY